MTTADLIQTSIPTFVYLISLVYTIPGEVKIYSRPLKLIFILVGFAGIAVLTYTDYLND